MSECACACVSLCACVHVSVYARAGVFNWRACVVTVPVRRFIALSFGKAFVAVSPQRMTRAASYFKF